MVVMFDLESHLSVINNVLLQNLLLTLICFTAHKILVLPLAFQFTTVVSQLGNLVRKALKQKESESKDCMYRVIKSNCDK